MTRNDYKCTLKTSSTPDQITSLYTYHVENTPELKNHLHELGGKVFPSKT